MASTIAFPAMVKELRLSKNLTMEQLAEELGKTKSTISKWEKGTRSPKIYEIEEIAKFFGVEPKKMMFGDNSTPTNPQVELIPSTLQKINATSSQLEHKRQLNVLDYAETQLEQQNTVGHSKNTVEEPQAAYYTYNYYDHAVSAGTGQYLNDVQVETIELPVDYDADFVIPVHGDSMEPEFHSGDYVFVKLSVELTDGDIGVFEYYGDAYIKQLLINAEGAFLHSFNSKYDDIPIDRDSDFRIIGEVIGSFTPVGM
ncbi:helix-turn-helix domain-containing protein [Streptococcus equi subsp. equi]|uniref:XRE family transcriptional regulator n=1 Tax=Streptococcus equi TaxID=1336 RepID=UPI0013F63F07|nr:S24 family peptidase [Streptococcus equi]MCD3381708.1 helix-turn-helix domain-containing protein [Streptococcus equi subsp. zooepidemicus]MCD3406714.1 helix-turn-helix domain-containing protein [Streptococcus equi subsp. zooepidemicus]MCD3473234.1 helix-turn-helix domain-containing protein [Streptococcus equi subsp. equi]MCD3499021.1 helix-turn-helix domain-containing protein [Streptococcus equi subsp. equi]QTC12172.1 LexA repressor [Streptococcus equi subsp. zooepidemicus]